MCLDRSSRTESEGILSATAVVIGSRFARRCARRSRSVADRYYGIRGLPNFSSTPPFSKITDRSLVSY
jgi:hypothetical protein